jgi:5-methyltetrahydropteroyltriglutamate--homocysteine methyltransferase
MGISPLLLKAPVCVEQERIAPTHWREEESGMPASARADTVGSLLRPAYLREARQERREGRVSEAELGAAEDRAVREAIALQEAAGLDVINDGELRRASWIITTAATSGHKAIAADPNEPYWFSLWKGPEVAPPIVVNPPARPYVTERIRGAHGLANTEYAFLKANAHTRTKFTIPAPSWHRVYWHPVHSRAAYPSAEDYLRDMRDYIRGVVEQIMAMGCDYVQLDAPNYGMFHCDAQARAFFASQGRDLAAERAFDIEIDNSVFAGISGLTRALHVCRGNNAGGRWVANGGYEAVAGELFPRLTNIDRLLLEYDTPRAGDFGPLRHALPQHTVVLGLLTTKHAALEDASAVEARIHEATQYIPLERLALSPQCGFASVEAGNPLTPAEQEAKLRLVSQVAQRVWRT